MPTRGIYSDVPYLTYKLSSYARLEAFVIQTKLDLNLYISHDAFYEQPG